MGNFQGGGSRRGGFGGGRPSFQKKSWGNDRGGGDRGDKTLFRATCSDCGQSCEVPFRPTGEKPVYCSNCFSSKRGGGDRGSRQDFGSRGPKREYNDRPAPRADFAQAPAHDDVKKQLGEIRIKLDRLIGAIEKLTGTKTETRAETKTEAKKDVPVEKNTPVVVLKEKTKKASVKSVTKKKTAAKKK